MVIVKCDKCKANLKVNIVGNHHEDPDEMYTLYPWWYPSSRYKNGQHGLSANEIRISDEHQYCKKCGKELFKELVSIFKKFGVRLK